MDNNTLQIKLKQRLNKIDSNDYDMIQAWEVAEAFNKAQIEWVRRQLSGTNMRQEGDEMSKRRIDDLEILLTRVRLEGVDVPYTQNFGYFESNNFGVIYDPQLGGDYLEFKRIECHSQQCFKAIPPVDQVLGTPGTPPIIIPGQEIETEVEVEIQVPYEVEQCIYQCHGGDTPYIDDPVEWNEDCADGSVDRCCIGVNNWQCGGEDSSQFCGMTAEEINALCSPQTTDVESSHQQGSDGCWYEYKQCRTVIRYRTEIEIQIETEIIPEIEIPGSPGTPGTDAIPGIDCWCAPNADQENFCIEPRSMTVYQSEVANTDVILRDPLKNPNFEWSETFCTFQQSEGNIVRDDPGAPAGSAGIRIWRKDFLIMEPYLIYYRVPRRIEILGSVDPYTGNQVLADVHSEFKDDIVEIMIDSAASILAGDISDMNQQQRTSTDSEKNN
tara:strand:+ start:1315 stop:2637 length:1323 start_codon:yes stop_codon:yes gene_type:complete